MSAIFKQVRKLQGERVRMVFDDGREVVALLLCATKDIDGAKHLIYDKIESGPEDRNAGDEDGCSYADAKTLVKIEPADARNRFSGPRGRNRLTMRDQFEEELARALRQTG
jgi:hypothetical protein